MYAYIIGSTIFSVFFCCLYCKEKVRNKNIHSRMFSILKENRQLQEQVIALQFLNNISNSMFGRGIVIDANAIEVIDVEEV